MGWRVFGLYIGGMGAGALWPLAFLNGPLWLTFISLGIGVAGAVLAVWTIFS